MPPLSKGKSGAISVFEAFVLQELLFVSQLEDGHPAVCAGQNHVPVVLVVLGHLLHQAKFGLLGPNLFAQRPNAVVLLGPIVVHVGEAAWLGRQGHDQDQTQGDKAKGGFDSG